VNEWREEEGEERSRLVFQGHEQGEEEEVKEERGGEGGGEGGTSTLGWRRWVGGRKRGLSPSLPSSRPPSLSSHNSKRQRPFVGSEHSSGENIYNF